MTTYPGEFAFISTPRGFSPRAIGVVKSEKVRILDFEGAFDRVGFRFSTKGSKPGALRVECSLLGKGRGSDQSRVMCRRGEVAYSDGERGIDASKEAGHDEKLPKMNVHRKFT